MAAILLAGPVAVAELGDDGLHKADWMRETFKNLREDLAEANAKDKRLMPIVEQRACIDCTRMHEEVFPRPAIADYLRENYFVVQIDLHGDIEVTDFDGEPLSEKQATRKWRLLFTPSILFLPDDVPEERSADEAAVAMMPGDVSYHYGAVEQSMTGQPDDPERGREVVGDKSLGNCVACHANTDMTDIPFHGEIGPMLDRAGERWSEAELRGIVANAEQMFPGTRMPAL